MGKYLEEIGIIFAIKGTSMNKIKTYWEMRDFCHILTKFILSAFLLLTMYSCDKVSQMYTTLITSIGNKGARVHYKECNQLNNIVYYNGNPYTGKVWAQDEESYLEVQDGHQIVIIGLYSNGSIAFKREFSSGQERILNCFSTEGKLIYKQIQGYIRRRPRIWDLEGNEIGKDDLSADPILSYIEKKIEPILKRAQSAYQNQLNTASYE